jgi:hypothetical protein
MLVIVYVSVVTVVEAWPITLMLMALEELTSVRFTINTEKTNTATSVTTASGFLIVSHCQQVDYSSSSSASIATPRQ